MMNSRLEALRQELSAPLLSADTLLARDQAAQTVDWILHYWQTLARQPVGRKASRAELEALLREPVPEEGRPFAEVLAEFEQKVVPYTFAVNHPRFLAFIPG